MRFFGHDIPKLSWLGGKTAKQGNSGRKNRSGYAQEHTAASAENASRTLAIEIDKAYQHSQEGPEGETE